MLTALRNSAQSWMIKALLGLIVITFVISFGIGTFTNPKEVLVIVDDEEIMVSQYLTRYQEELERLRQRFPDNADELAAQINLREQVFKDMINRYLILEAARRDGLQVTEEEVRAAVTLQDAFKVNNHFDFSTYQQILQQNRLTPTGYEAKLSQDLLVNKHQRSLLAGMILNDMEVDQRYRIENEQVEVEYLFVDPARFKPDKPVTEESAREYHEKHPTEFTQDEQFSLRYFVLPLSRLEADQKVHPRAVERYYERHVEAEFSIPKKVRASHILKRLGKEASPEEEAKLRGEMDKIAARARKGEDFAKLARTQSEDFSKDKGGDLGFFARGDMVPAFASAAFSLPEGQISDPVRSAFGFHIIKVTGIQEGNRKPLDEVRKTIEAQLLTRLAERKMEIEIERLPTTIDREGLDKVAEGFGVAPSTTELFDGSGQIKGLGSSALLYIQLKGKRKGHVGVWKRNPVQGHVFYEIAESRKSFVKPFEEVRKESTAKARLEIQRQAALTEARSILPELKSTKDFSDYARKRGLRPQTTAFTVVSPTIEGLGANPEFQRSAFQLNKEKPFAINIKDNRAFLLRFKRRFYKEPEKEKELKENVRNQLGARLAQFITQQEIDRLRSTVKIDILAPEYLFSASGGSPAR